MPILPRQPQRPLTKRQIRSIERAARKPHVIPPGKSSARLEDFGPEGTDLPPAFPRTPPELLKQFQTAKPRRTRQRPKLMPAILTPLKPLPPTTWQKVHPIQGPSVIHRRFIGRLTIMAFTDGAHWRWELRMRPSDEPSWANSIEHGNATSLRKAKRAAERAALDMVWIALVQLAITPEDARSCIANYGPVARTPRPRRQARKRK